MYVQELFAYNFAKERDDKTMLVRMMNSRPSALVDEVLSMWNRMTPFNIDVME